MLSPLTPLLLMLVGLVTGAPHWNKTSDSAEWDPIPHSHSQSQHIARSEREVFAETSTRALLNIVFDDEYRIVFDEEKLKGFYNCLCSNDSERCDFTLVKDTTRHGHSRDVTVGVVTQHNLKLPTPESTQHLKTSFVCRKVNDHLVACKKQAEEMGVAGLLQNNTVVNIVGFPGNECPAGCVNILWKGRESVGYRGIGGGGRGLYTPTQRTCETRIIDSSITDRNVTDTNVNDTNANDANANDTNVNNANVTDYSEIEETVKVVVPVPGSGRENSDRLKPVPLLIAEPGQASCKCGGSLGFYISAGAAGSLAVLIVVVATTAAHYIRRQGRKLAEISRTSGDGQSFPGGSSEGKSVSDKTRIIDDPKQDKDDLSMTEFENPAYLNEEGEQEQEETHYKNYKDLRSMSKPSASRDKDTSETVSVLVYGNMGNIVHSVNGDGGGNGDGDGDDGDSFDDFDDDFDDDEFDDVGLEDETPYKEFSENEKEPNSENIYSNFETQREPENNDLADVLDCEYIAVDELNELSNKTAQNSGRRDSANLKRPPEKRPEQEYGESVQDTRPSLERQSGAGVAVDATSSCQAERRNAAATPRREPRDNVYTRLSVSRDDAAANMGGVQDTYNTASRGFEDFMLKKRESLLSSGKTRNSNTDVDWSGADGEEAAAGSDGITGEGQVEGQGHSYCPPVLPVERSAEHNGRVETGQSVYFELEQTAGMRMKEPCTAQEHGAQAGGDCNTSSVYFELMRDQGEIYSSNA